MLASVRRKSTNLEHKLCYHLLALVLVSAFIFHQAKNVSVEKKQTKLNEQVNKLFRLLKALPRWAPNSLRQ